MSSERRWRLVCYDVREERRYRQVHKIVKGAGEAVQYSVFRCRLDDKEAERLRWRLSQVMTSDDALLVVDLCPSCAERVVARNVVDGWTVEPPTFRILATSATTDQGSPDVRKTVRASRRKDRGSP